MSVKNESISDLTADQSAVQVKIKGESEEEEEPVFHISVSTGRMQFTLLRQVQDVKFVAWKDCKRKQTVTVGESHHTRNIGSEGVIIDGGTQANSFYVTSTCFAFSLDIMLGVEGHLTSDNLLAGDIVEHFSCDTRNCHPNGYRFDMFPRDAYIACPYPRKYV